MASFLAIDDLETLRAPTRDGRAWAGNSMFGEAFEGISRSPIGRYPEALPPDQVCEIEVRLEPAMRRLSYPLGRPLTLEERMRGRVARVKWDWGSFRSGRQAGAERPSGSPGR
jgi:hypothetical protein